MRSGDANPYIVFSTIHSLSSGSAYALLFLGQFFAATAQPIFQCLGPKYAETFFDLKGRTTATMVLSIVNPIGGALGQLLSPNVGDTKQSILVLGIMSSAAAPFVFLISAAPPTPPTYSASKKAPGLLSLLRVVVNRARPTDPSMSVRERVDFTILFFVFGVLAAASLERFRNPDRRNLASGWLLIGHGWLYGCHSYSERDRSRLRYLPLFDRVFTSHLAITAKVLVPILSVAWLVFIWIVKPHNAAVIYVLCVIVGVASVTMLPVSLELACEVTRNAEGSSSLLWFACNAFTIMFILVEGALRAGPSANPPLNMRHSLIFNGVVVMTTCVSVFFLRGQQTRKHLDQEKQQRHSISLEVRLPMEPAGEP
ncbi:hypothetical protein K438DRAFT_1957299 [Mycena galopus ATCC 62051]|nr:hypothetical protein K438DRAFT_1957299 [Mycena galopus ATCC 62051]